MRNRNKKAIIAFSVFIVILLVLLISIGIYKQRNKYDKVAAFKISLKNTTLDEINNNSKENKYKKNSLKIEYDNKEILFDNNITIKGRGNTSWFYVKKSYQIVFDREVNLLNLGKAKKWVLLSNYSDETLLRNHMAFYLSNKLDMTYAPKGINIDLYVDNVYLGVYYLTPKISITDSSVNLKNKDGIVVELDNNYFFEEDEYYTSSYNQDHLVIKDVKDKNYEKTAITNFMNDYNSLYDALNQKDWQSINSLIDVESFAKYYIINKLSNNGDAYRSSFYMYQDGKKDKIHAGPIWDFDLAFYNDMLTKNYFMFAENKINDKFEISAGLKLNHDSQIISKLLEFAEFNNMVEKLWNKELKNSLNGVLKEVDRNYLLIKDSANKDKEKWNLPNDYETILENFKNIIIDSYKDFNNQLKES